MTNAQIYLRKLKVGDKIAIQTPSGIKWETITHFTPYPRHPDNVTIYTEESGMYWHSTGQSRYGSKHPDKYNYIIIPPEYHNEIPS